MKILNHTMIISLATMATAALSGSETNNRENPFGKGADWMEARSDFTKKKCVPCNANIPALKGAQLKQCLLELGNGWQVIDEHYLEKEYLFNDFAEALAFTNRVGEIAEQEGHHPDIYLSYGKVKILLWTHKIDGLSESDFIIASKCDEVL